ncbi:hypothetical protein JOQ06_017004 [Pogonophryne albipinna]|uniref:Uncharacterized protein n=1 Tax=Pogonophryne albipinna TaxID=1090488 RepID=A0AAD6B0F3_9TELE|nr:hypothetical protein JOQ06_017004 [Pogonophryne albipinna]
MDVGSLYREARVIVMTRHDLGGRPAEEGALKGSNPGKAIQKGKMGLTFRQAAEGGNKFTAFSENMAASCVMDHGASDGPSGEGPMKERMGTQSSKKKGVTQTVK